MNFKRPIGPILIAALSVSLLSCNSANAAKNSCASGELTVDGDGGIVSESFPETTKDDARNGVQKLADALSSGNDYSLSVMFQAGDSEQSFFRTIVAHPKSTVRYQFPDRSVVISSFEAPKLAFTPENATFAERVPNAQMANVVVESSGRMFVESEWPQSLFRATWCVE